MSVAVDHFHVANIRGHLTRMREALDHLRRDLPADRALYDIGELIEWALRRLPDIGRDQPRETGWQERVEKMDEARSRRLRQVEVAAGRDDGRTPACKLMLNDRIVDYPTCDINDPDTGHEWVTGEVVGLRFVNVGTQITVDTDHGRVELLLDRNERVLVEPLR